MENKNSFNLTGRVALVTGGGRGLGRAFCEGMAEFGADVVCADYDETRGQETAELIRKYGHRAIAVKADVSSPNQVESLVRKAIDEMGTIDILINNAGITAQASKIFETPLEVWDRVIAVDLTGVFLCMRAVIPVMLKQKRGSIINISSGSAFGGNRPGIVPPCYGAAKAGVVNLTRVGAVEHARDGIRVNCIAPGFFDTGLGALADSEQEKRRIKLFQEVIDRDIPLGRQAQPGEIKGMAVFLASDASSYVTGQVFIPDGGFLAQI
jgi:NAD(P)-dependent dehydrogenase (short-subunit alcohol dehydrogenase family)